jgi:hypothetical protein
MKVRDGNIVMESTEEVRMQDGVLSKPTIKGYGESHISVSSSEGDATIDLENESVFSISVTENTTFIFSNPPVSGKAGSFSLILTQNADAKTITWPASVMFAGGEAPDLSTNSAIYILTFLTVNGGTTWYGFLSGSEMAVPT